VRDAYKTIRAAAFASATEIEALAAEVGALPAPEIVKILGLLVDKALVADPRAHKIRCQAFAAVAERSLDPELFVPYLRALRQGDATVRAALVPILPKVNRVAGHGELCQLLGVPEPGVRAAAAEVLRQVAGKSAFESLAALVRQPQFAGRTEAIDVILPKGGHHAIPLLEAVLRSGTKPEKAHALRYLKDRRFVGKDLPAALRVASDTAHDPDEEIAGAAIGAMAALVDDEAAFVEELGELMESSGVPIVKAVVAALARLESPRLRALLEARFRAGPSPIRIAVLEAAESIGSEDVVPLVVQALSHKQLPVRTKAADVLAALGQSGKIDPARTIIWLLRSRDVNVRRLAVEIAAKIRDGKGDLAPRLLRFLRDEDWWVRERVIDALVEMSGKALTPHLVEYLKDPSDVVRRYAIGGLRRLADARALGALVRSAMGDEDWWCRELAIEAVAELGDPRAIPYLLDILAKQPQARVACLAALATMKATDTALTVAERLRDDDADVRLEAVRCLGVLDDPSVSLWLAACETDESTEVRLAARELLLRWALAGGGSASAKAGQLSALDQWLVAIVDAGADDLYLAAERVPYAKRMGRMVPLAKTPITNDQLTSALVPHLSAVQREALAEGREVDFSYEVRVKNLRFRANVFRQMTGLAAVFRTIKAEIMSVDRLGLPGVVARFGELKHGLVLVGGPTGSGKSTTLAALVDHINRSSDRHIVTIEDPIEVVHRRVRCLVNQREVGTHTRSFENALRATLREDPDVILVGELRDLDTIQFAVTAAETGHLVFGTLHTVSADTSVDRLINAFPPRQQAQVRSMLCETLRAVACQHLLRRKDGKGRVLAVEVMINNDAVANMIRKGKAFQIPSVIATSRDAGMQSMDSELARLVREGHVDADEAYMKSNDKKAFEGLAGGEGAAPKPAAAQPAPKPAVQPAPKPR
jgi:twitching motility protein PilT